MRLSAIFTTAALVATAACNVVPRQQQFVGYMISTFTDPDPRVHQYLSNGNNPLSFRKLNNGNPTLGSTVGTRAVRDIFVTTNSARSEYFIIATDLDINASGFNWDIATRRGSRSLTVWRSTNLIDWSGPFLRTVETNTAGMAWAPSAVWDDATGRYFVFWASRHYSTNDPNHTGAANLDRIRFATTTDFVTFSAPADYLAPPGTPVIDQEFLNLGGNEWIRFIKNETVNQMYQERSQSGLFGSWQRNAGYIRNESPREGAVAFRDNGNANLYHLWIDDYVEYIPYETTNIRNPGIWTASNRGSFPRGLKHGSVFPVTQAEYDRIRSRYPS